MKTIIGDYVEGKLTPATYTEGDVISENILQELKGRFVKAYRDANIAFTEEQLAAAATPDQDIIQAVHSLESLDSTLNSIGKYLVEWYELHHPKEDVTWDELALMPITQPGMQELQQALNAVMQARERISEHITDTMKRIMPNTCAVATPILGAKMLSSAGGIKRFAGMPSTTVQLLGAEQALFRHLRGKVPPPKHGILFNHPLVQKVHPKNRGKMARTLGNAIAIAVKVDYHKGEYVGDMLHKKTEKVYHAFTRV